MTIKIVLDVDVDAWQEQYPDDGPLAARDTIGSYVQHLVASSPPVSRGLWRVIEHPSSWRPPSRLVRDSGLCEPEL